VVCWCVGSARRMAALDRCTFRASTDVGSLLVQAPLAFACAQNKLSSELVSCVRQGMIGRRSNDTKLPRACSNKSLHLPALTAILSFSRLWIFCSFPEPYLATGFGTASPTIQRFRPWLVVVDKTSCLGAASVGLSHLPIFLYAEPTENNRGLRAKLL
jgi:hypothetical protein